MEDNQNLVDRMLNEGKKHYKEALRIIDALYKEQKENGVEVNEDEELYFVLFDLALQFALMENAYDDHVYNEPELYFIQVIAEHGDLMKLFDEIDKERVHHWRDFLEFDPVDIKICLEELHYKMVNATKPLIDLFFNAVNVVPNPELSDLIKLSGNIKSAFIIAGYEPRRFGSGEGFDFLDDIFLYAIKGKVEEKELSFNGDSPLRIRSFKDLNKGLVSFFAGISYGLGVIINEQGDVLAPSKLFQSTDIAEVEPLYKEDAFFDPGEPIFMKREEERGDISLLRGVKAEWDKRFLGIGVLDQSELPAEVFAYPPNGYPGEYALIQVTGIKDGDYEYETEVQLPEDSILYHPLSSTVIGFVKDADNDLASSFKEIFGLK